MHTPSEIDGSGTRRKRWLRWWVWALVGVLALVAGGGGFIWVEQARSVELGETAPVDGSVLGESAVTISSALPGYVPGRGTVTLLVDGQALDLGQLVLEEGAVTADLSLDDGRHEVALQYTSSNVFSRQLARTWSFSVDTTAPNIDVLSPVTSGLLEDQVTHVEVEVDEPATVELHVDGEPRVMDAGGEAVGPFVADLALSEGEHSFVLSAVDPVGNSSSFEWQALADYESPVIQFDDWPGGEEPVHDTSVGGHFVVADSVMEGLTVQATLDGQPLALEEPQDAEQAGGQRSGRVFDFSSGGLTEGSHEVSVLARDRAGHEDTWQGSVVVDSSSAFGSKTMSLGAIGRDVDELQALLRAKGLYEGDTTATYDEATTQAVAEYNAQHDLDYGGTVGPDTLALLRGSIRIDLSDKKLYHYRDGELRKIYSVAVGMPAYPTPTGSFHIISKVVDPTWTPPDSDWAQGMEPVGPGPGNPLGTRWMGIDSPSVGIHGTYTSSSVGTAASHGCIRMYLKEAEELFGLVFIGTPVEIVP